MGYSFQTPTQNYLNRRDSIIAGSYLALGIVGSNPSKKTFEKLEANLKQTKQILESGNEAQIVALSREKLFGDMFVVGVQGYYTQHMAQSKVMSLKFRTMHQPIPMAGTFGYEPYQRTLLGLNRGIEKHGVYMNVRTAQAITDRFGDNSKAKQLMLQIGMLGSALEHQVPEQMFSDPDGTIKAEGVSTAKALGIAIRQGQRVYVINQQNQATTLQALRLDSLAMSEIRSALAAGKEITAHTDQLTVSGFRGSGYAITDPVTGEGVYKISGGKNGGFCAIPEGVCPKSEGNLPVACLLAGLGMTLLVGSTIGVIAGMVSGPITAAMTFAIALTVGLSGVFLIAAAVALVDGDEESCNYYLSMALGILVLNAIASFVTAQLASYVASSGSLFPAWYIVNEICKTK